MSKVAEALKHYKVIVMLSTDSVSEVEKILDENGYFIIDEHINLRFGVLDVLGIESLENHFHNVDVICNFVDEGEEIITYLW